MKTQYTTLLKISPNFEITSSINPTLAITTTTNSLVLDMQNVVKASQKISSDLELNKLLFNMMKIIIETAGAQKGVLLLNNKGTLAVEAEYTPMGQINVLQATALQDWKGAHSVVEYVKNTCQTVTLNRAVEDKQFGFDGYITQHRLKSLLCMPIMKQEELKGILYIENNLIYYAFPQNRVTVLTILTSQMAISLENARLMQTELGAINKVVEEQRQRVEEAEQNRKRLTDYIDTFSHGLRNPLTGIEGSNLFIQKEVAAIRTSVVEINQIPAAVKERLINNLATIDEQTEASQHVHSMVQSLLTMYWISLGWRLIARN